MQEETEGVGSFWREGFGFALLYNFCFQYQVPVS